MVKLNRILFRLAPLIFVCTAFLAGISKGAGDVGFNFLVNMIVGFGGAIALVVLGARNADRL